MSVPSLSLTSAPTPIPTRRPTVKPSRPSVAPSYAPRYCLTGQADKQNLHQHTLSTSITTTPTTTTSSQTTLSTKTFPNAHLTNTTILFVSPPPPLNPCDAMQHVHALGASFEPLQHPHREPHPQPHLQVSPAPPPLFYKIYLLSQSQARPTPSFNP